MAAAVNCSRNSSDAWPLSDDDAAVAAFLQEYSVVSLLWVTVVGVWFTFLAVLYALYITLCRCGDLSDRHRIVDSESHRPVLQRLGAPRLSVRKEAVKKPDVENFDDGDDNGSDAAQEKRHLARSTKAAAAGVDRPKVKAQSVDRNRVSTRVVRHTIDSMEEDGDAIVDIELGEEMESEPSK